MTIAFVLAKPAFIDGTPNWFGGSVHVTRSGSGFDPHFRADWSSTATNIHGAGSGSAPGSVAFSVWIPYYPWSGNLTIRVTFADGAWNEQSFSFTYP